MGVGLRNSSYRQIAIGVWRGYLHGSAGFDSAEGGRRGDLGDDDSDDDDGGWWRAEDDVVDLEGGDESDVAGMV